MPADDSITSVDQAATRLAAHGYLAGRELATAVFLAVRLRRPLFLEGEAGVGKTELAKALAQVLDTELIRRLLGVEPRRESSMAAGDGSCRYLVVPPNG